MLIEFQNTFEDYSEGTVVIATRRRERIHTLGIRIGFIAAFVAYYIVARWLWGLTGTEQLVIWIHVLMPGAAVILVGAILGLIAIARPGLFPRPNLRTIISASIIVFLMIQIWVLSYFFHLFSSKAVRNLHWQILLPHSTWLFMMVAIIIFSFLNRGKILRRDWDHNVALHRPQIADISANGITFTDAFRKSEYQWQGFSSCEETKNLFLISIGTGAFFMIPKRAFETTEQLEAMRSLVKRIQTPGSAFQVLPVAVPA